MFALTKFHLEEMIDLTHIDIYKFCHYIFVRPYMYIKKK